MTALCCPSTR
ncbi:Putative Cysteine--tRNA ligase gene leader peptide [Deinococcus deserti]|uniref:Putative Cysteine--tRNA ligase gene leader peptide n=1 Tax=Deinococcus deserti (strain DSM 17065 / CIP 109153 / LMG 22923 / VCD115) TaxID=546414 RepID=X5GY33_DEIDV|nr:putative Cysteine--tRNA ligase gene leader peptide [Deinococcus deserti VCD115]